MMAEHPEFHRGVADPNYVNTDEPYQFDYWAGRLRVTPEKLRELIAKHGNRVADLEAAAKAKANDEG